MPCPYTGRLVLRKTNIRLARWRNRAHAGGRTKRRLPRAKRPSSCAPLIITLKEVNQEPTLLIALSNEADDWYEEMCRRQINRHFDAQMPCISRLTQLRRISPCVSEVRIGDGTNVTLTVGSLPRCRHGCLQSGRDRGHLLSWRYNQVALPLQACEEQNVRLEWVQESRCSTSRPEPR